MCRCSLIRCAERSLWCTRATLDGLPSTRVVRPSTARSPGSCGCVEMPALTLQLALAIVALPVLGAACAFVPESSARSTDVVSNTWSVAGVDVNTREVGVALATCIEAQHRITASNLTIAERSTSAATYGVHGVVSGGLSFELARLVGGAGALVAQGLVDRANADRLDRATAQLVAGASAGSVVEAAKIDDPRSEERQYAVVTLLPDVSSFTGSSTGSWAGAQVAGAVSVPVQGNLLVGPEVIEEALAAFGRVSGRPGATLGDALMSALEAGAVEGGDKRCPKSQSALRGFHCGGPCRRRRGHPPPLVSCSTAPEGWSEPGEALARVI